MSPQFSSRAKSLRIVAFLLAIAGIFTLDCLAPDGFAPWVLYVLPLYLTSDPTLPFKPAPIMALFMALSAIAFFIKLPTTEWNSSLFNRGFASIAGWCVTVLILRARKEEAARERNNEELKRIQARLAEKEATLSTIFRSIPAGIGLVRGRKLMYVNVSLTRMTGYAASELEGKDVSILYHDHSEYERVGGMYGLFARMPTASYNARLRKKDGSVRDVHVILAPIVFGKPSEGIVFSIFDLTAFKRVQAERDRQKRMFETLAEHTPNVIFILDKEMRYTYINTAAERLTGVSRDLFIGKTSVEVGMPEDSRKIWEECFRAAISSRQACTVESDFPSKEGARHYVNVNVPLFNAAGELENVLGFAYDITDLKNTQIMLEKRAAETEESHRILQALMDNVPEGIIVAEAASGKILAVSKYARAIATSPDAVLSPDVIQENADIWVLLDDNGMPLPVDQYPLTQVIKTGKVILNQEMNLRTARGGEVKISVNASPIYGRKDVITGGIAVWRDITRLKQAEEILRRDRQTFEQLVMQRTKDLVDAQLELENARRLSDIGGLAATVAHELRNPLSVIRTAAFNIHRACGGNRLERSFSNIDKKISESDQIINNLLFYSRLKTPHLERVELQPFMNELIDTFRKRYVDLTLEVDFDGIKGESIAADPLQLNELFSNIINNAHDAVKEKKGTVKVLFQKRADGVLFEFNDNGVGMNQEQLSRMYEPFYTTKSKGTGLGMSVSRQIVSLHKGSLRVESEPGQGTSVKVYLPKE